MFSHVMLCITNSDSKLKIHILSIPPFHINKLSFRPWRDWHTQIPKVDLSCDKLWHPPLWLPPTSVSEDLD